VEAVLLKMSELADELASVEEWTEPPLLRLAQK
jgi:hypothetical protein